MRLHEFVTTKNKKPKLDEGFFIPIAAGLAAGLTIQDMMEYKKRFQEAGGGKAGWDAIKSDLAIELGITVGALGAGKLIHKGWKALNDLRKKPDLEQKKLKGADQTADLTGEAEQSAYSESRDNKKSLLTNVGIKPKEERVDPDGTYSPLGTNNQKPIPLTANAAVKVDNAVKLQKLKKSK